jgi:Domain of unknown function (DUF222)
MEIGSRVLAQVNQATALLQAASAALDEVTPPQAVRLAQGLAQAEKVAMAATRRALLRAGDEGSRRHGGERDMASLAAKLTGTSKARARQGLRSAARAAALAPVAQAYRNGSLSLDQAAVVTEAAALAPALAPDLLAAAERSSLAGLRATAAAARSAHHGEAAMAEHERHLGARRFCRLAPLGHGGLRLEALVPSEEAAALAQALQAAADAHWKRAWAAGVSLSGDQARADALVALVTGNRTEGATGTTGPQVVVVVDAAALVRGGTHEGETCTIEGIGPVPVASARGLLGEALLTLLVKDGADVRCVTSSTRVVPTRVRQALMVRDPTCVVPGCSQRLHLEIDHWRLDFSLGGLSAIDNLCRLCPVHHRLKTRTGWRLVGGPGRWRWLPPRPVPGRRPPPPRPVAATAPAPTSPPTPVPARE